MSAILWFGVLIAAAFAAHWGAEQLAKPLRKVTRQWGLTAAAAGAMLALFTAGSEVLINVTSALRNVAAIGLGTTLGSSIIHVPAIVTVVYLATRKRQLGHKNGEEHAEDTVEDGEQPGEHRQHVAQHFLRVRREAVTVLTLPYLILVVLIAALTVPAGWRGLQPVDGVILVIAYAVYLGQAILRGRKQGDKVEWAKKELGLAAAGIVVMGFGAFWMVRATENIVSTFGISAIVGGLFITAVASSAPEWFSSWSVARSGQVTPAVAVVIGDHAVTLTVGLLPLALITLPINNLPLYITSLAFVGLIPALYAAFIHWGGKEHGFNRWQVVALDAAYVGYVVIVVFWVLNIL